MKVISTLFVVLMFVSFAVEAKSPAAVDEKRMESFLSNIDQSLKSDNNGVKFWALFLLARLKSDDPEMDLSRFNKTLDRIIDKEKEELIRVNAKMTYLYLNEPELVQSVRVLDRENPLVFYAQLFIQKYNNNFGLDDVNATDQIKELLSQIEELENEM